MKVVFFKIPKPKRFKYPPRYYDEEKERRGRRRKELGIGENGSKADFKSQVGTSWKRLRKTDKGRQKKANMSVIIYLLIVAMVIYFVFFA